MKNYIIKIFTLGVCVIPFAIFAQQEAQFTQYNDNMLYYNPAYAGSREVMNITALYRQQWVGIEGAPVTQSLAFHTPLKYESIGLGVSVLNDKIGPLNQTWLNVDASYTLRFKRHKGKLSFGVKGGINLVNNRVGDLYATDQNDILSSGYLKNEMLPNFGGGIYYHTDKFYVGVGVPRIIESKPDFNQLNFDDQRHYYASIGGYFKFNRMLKLRPSAMFKVTDNAPFALDLSASLIYYDKLWLGANYRLNESAGILFQYQFSNQFKLGYSYDFSVNKLMRFNYGTHEILLSYDFMFKKKSLSTPRYF